MPKPRDEWYSKFINDMKSEMEINIYNPNDIQRLRVPDPEHGGTKPLFEKGLRNTVEEKNLLYQYAKEGKLFVFQKETNNPYQVTDQGIYSCQKEDEKEKASFSQKAGYWGVSFAWAVPRFGIGLAGRLFNLATGGIFKNQVAALGKGLDMMTSAWSEKLFSVNAQDQEVGIKDRIGNFLTAGTYQKDKIEAQKREDELYEERDKIRLVLDGEKDEWIERDRREEKLQEENPKSQKEIELEKELAETRKKLQELESAAAKKNPDNPIANNNVNREQQNENEVKQQKNENEVQHEEQVLDNPNEVKQEQVQNPPNEDNNNEIPEDAAKEMKSQLQLRYESIQLAFAPNGGGIQKAATLAADMNLILKDLQENPEKAQASGLTDEEIKRYSNMCTNMETIVKDGLTAKETLMQLEQANKLSAEERERHLCQLQLMNMVERAMVNFAFQDYFDPNKQKGMSMAEKKTSMLFEAMHKDPEAFKENMYESIAKLHSTENMMQMTPEQLSDYLAKPSNLRQAQTNDIHKGAEQVRNEKAVMERQQQAIEAQIQQPNLNDPQHRPLERNDDRQLI